MKKVDNFFNKLASELDIIYFPTVNFYRDDEKCAKVHYAIERFNNGCISYNKLIGEIAKNCKASCFEIHKIVKKHILDFEGFSYKY